MLLNPTPPEKLCDQNGQPYFLRDVEMTLDAFKAQLVDPDPDVRAHAIGKLLRQARTDDALVLVTVAQIRRDWERVVPFLGNRRPFWEWLVPELERRGW